MVSAIRCPRQRSPTLKRTSRFRRFLSALWRTRPVQRPNRGSPGIDTSSDLERSPCTCPALSSARCAGNTKTSHPPFQHAVPVGVASIGSSGEQKRHGLVPGLCQRGRPHFLCLCSFEQGSSRELETIRTARFQLPLPAGRPEGYAHSGTALRLSDQLRALRRGHSPLAPWQRGWPSNEGPVPSCPNSFGGWNALLTGGAESARESKHESGVRSPLLPPSGRMIRHALPPGLPFPSPSELGGTNRRVFFWPLCQRLITTGLPASWKV